MFLAHYAVANSIVFLPLLTWLLALKIFKLTYKVEENVAESKRRPEEML